MTGEFPAQMASNAENVFIDDVIIMIHLSPSCDEIVVNVFIK